MTTEMQENEQENATASAIDENGVYHTPQAAIDAVTANPPFSPESADGDDKPAKGKLIGMACGTNCIVAWNVADGLTVNVVTERDKDHSDIWHSRATVGRDTRVMATIFGGRWQADVYTRMMRNALTARAKRLRRHRENRKAKKAAIAAANAERGDLCHED